MLTLSFGGGRAQDGEGVFVAKDNQWNYVRHGTGHCRTMDFHCRSLPFLGLFTADHCERQQQRVTQTGRLSAAPRRLPSLQQTPPPSSSSSSPPPAPREFCATVSVSSTISM